MNPDGSGQHRVPNTDGGEYPSWSPDGKPVAFNSNLTGDHVMYIVDVDGSNLVDLSRAGRCNGRPTGVSSCSRRIATIRKTYEQYGMLVDPHTADGLKVGLEHRETGVPLICLETALPVKFSESIVEAIGQEPARPAGYENIESMPQRYVVMNADADAIKAFIAEQTGQP